MFLFRSITIKISAYSKNKTIARIELSIFIHFILILLEFKKHQQKNETNFNIHENKYSCQQVLPQWPLTIACIEMWSLGWKPQQLYLFSCMLKLILFSRCF